MYVCVYQTYQRMYIKTNSEDIAFREFSTGALATKKHFCGRGTALPFPASKLCTLKSHSHFRNGGGVLRPKPNPKP